MFNREKAIQTLIDDDFASIVECEAFDYLEGLLRGGMKGYQNFTDEELMQELQERDISYLFGETE